MCSVIDTCTFFSSAWWTNTSECPSEKRLSTSLPETRDIASSSASAEKAVQLFIDGL